MRKGKVKNLHCEIEPRMRLEKERRQVREEEERGWKAQKMRKRKVRQGKKEDDQRKDS